MRDVLVRARAGSGARRFAMRALGATAVIGIVMLGNLRLHASEVADHRAAVTRVADRPATRAAVTLHLATTTDGDRTDDVQLVPAIYAWNPDVRFVYFRNVSKWM